MESNENEKPVLDILIIKFETKVITDLYCKKTDSHQYFIFNPCHPSPTNRNIPFNKVRRICTIVINEDHREARFSQNLRYFSADKNTLYN
jgi:hypothetical protein